MANLRILKELRNSRAAYDQCDQIGLFFGLWATF